MSIWVSGYVVHLLFVFYSLVIFKKDISEIHLEWLESIISYVFTGLWMLPMFVITTPINNLWFRDIAVECYDHMKKRQHDLKKPKQRWSLKMLITDLLYGVAIEVVFMIQASIIKLVPIGGWVIALFHMALLYSLYSFEYKWSYQGVTVQRRLSCIESHWPYFLGYGFPLAVLTSTPLLSPFAVGGSRLRHTAGNIILSACVFALAFPLMVLGAFSVTHSELSFNRLPIFKLARILCNNLFRLVLPKR